LINVEAVMPTRRTFLLVAALATAFTPYTVASTPCSPSELASLSTRSIPDLLADVREIGSGPTVRVFGGDARLECRLRAVPPAQLAAFKFDLEYDGDAKDLVEYVFHDIDSADRQKRVTDHFATAPPQQGVKVLSDVDDTLYANLVDHRYPSQVGNRRIFYPGVVAFYDALSDEPAIPEARLQGFGVGLVPVTALSARPRLFESSTLGDLGTREPPSAMKLRLMPSVLPGEVLSSTIGTLETLAGHRLPEPLTKEQDIAKKKFSNFLAFAGAYPDYDYVFVGDSGQADGLAADLMVTTKAAWSTRVRTTFIHALKDTSNRQPENSPTFDQLKPTLRISRDSASGRGVIVFGNYIEAAAIAYAQRASLKDLITADELVAVTVAALADFEVAGVAGSTRELLRGEYRAAAVVAADLLKPAGGAADPAAPIRRLLATPFWTVPGAPR
jgi:hypothetical protein